MTHQLGKQRNVLMLDKASRNRIASHCADHIHRHIVLLNNMCQGVVTENKLRSTCVGLLYLMRYGITMHGFVVLHQEPVLRRILPMESLLQPVFNIRSKTVTEVENTVKIVLRAIDRSDLARVLA